MTNVAIQSTMIPTQSKPVHSVLARLKQSYDYPPRQIAKHIQSISQLACHTDSSRNRYQPKEYHIDIQPLTATNSKYAMQVKQTFAHNIIDKIAKLPSTTRNQNPPIKCCRSSQYSFALLECKPCYAKKSSYSGSLINMAKFENEKGINEIKSKCFNSMHVTRVLNIEKTIVLPPINFRKKKISKAAQIGFNGCKILHRRSQSNEYNKYAFNIAEVKIQKLPNIDI